MYIHFLTRFRLRSFVGKYSPFEKYFSESHFPEKYFSESHFPEKYFLGIQFVGIRLKFEKVLENIFWCLAIADSAMSGDQRWRRQLSTDDGWLQAATGGQ